MLVDHLRAMAGAYGSETAYRVVDGGGVTFAEWDAESNALGRAFSAAGVERGDRVALLLSADEALRFVVAYAAVHKAGAVAVPTNTRLSPRELARIFGHAEPRLVVTDDVLGDTAVSALDECGGSATLWRVPASEAPWSWSAAAAQPTAEYQVEVGADDLADILYTSGTTGAPKGVAIRHRNLALIPGRPNPSWSDRAWMHSSPLFTFAGIGFIYNPMQLGLRGVYQPHFDAGRWLEVVEEERPMAVFLVPSMAQLLVAHPRFADADLSSIQICAIGSAPLQAATLRAMQERMPEAAVSNSYGMTEAGPAYCAMPKGESLRRIGSVGRPMPPLEVRFVDDEGTDVPDGEVGEVLIRLEGRQREYYRDPEATAATWRSGWLHSGDLGRLDEDGYLYIVGRKKDVIIRGGNNVHAADVEAVLYENPAVLEAAVVGIAHPVLGEDVAAVVVPVSGSSLDAAAVIEWCRPRLADYKLPRKVVIVDSLPRNATGKVLKAQLAELFVNASS